MSLDAHRVTIRQIVSKNPDRKDTHGLKGLRLGEERSPLFMSHRIYSPETLTYLTQSSRRQR